MKPARNSVGIAYVHGESVKSVFMGALINNVLIHPDNQWIIGGTRGQPGVAILAEARNKTVRWMLAYPHLEWLWCIDADMEPTPETLPTLLDAATGPCIATAAVYLGNGEHLAWGRYTKGGDIEWVDGVSETVTDLHVCGAACMLVHRKVLEAVEASHSDDPWPWFGYDVDNGERRGEDVTFCCRARDAGFPVIGVNTPVRHHKLRPVDPLPE